MAHYISTSCPICDSDTTWTTPERRDGFPIGIIDTHCLNCGFRKEIYIDTPALKRGQPQIQKKESILR